MLRKFVVWAYNLFGHCVYVLTYREEYKGRTRILTKIGESTEPPERIKAIQRDLPYGEIIHQQIYTVFNGKAVERNLHRKYWEKKARPTKAGSQAGRDEFFALKRTEKVIIHFHLGVLQFLYAFSPFFLILLIMSIFFILNTTQWHVFKDFLFSLTRGQ